MLQNSLRYSALQGLINDHSFRHHTPSSSIMIVYDVIDVLIQRLADIGVRDKVLEWFRSYLVDRTTSVKVNNSRSCCSLVKYGVPQGSVLGQTLFNVYCRPLGRIIRKHDTSYHMYADDSQLYVDFSPCDEKTALANLQQCIHEVREWLRENFLLLNDNKTYMANRLLAADLLLQV